MFGMRRVLLSTSPMMRGDDVLIIQRRLAASGMGPAQDGLYGDGTAAAVRRFQSLHGLQADGIVGPLTWKALFGDEADAGAQAREPLSPGSLAALCTMHGFYSDGYRWRLGPSGVEVDGNDLVAFSLAERAQAASVMARFRQELIAVLATYHVPIELVIACICAESGGRPESRRLEPGCDRNNPENTPSRISFGLMQTLLSTAQTVLRQPRLRLSELERPEISILAGAGYMEQQSRQTRFDPPLAAAAYNAGSLRYNNRPNNRWKLVNYPIGTSQHVDRFLRSFNAAMAVMETVELPANVPSLHRLLQGIGAAANVFDRVAPRVGQDAPDEGDEPRWLSIARGEIGQKEAPGDADNPRIVEYFKATTFGTHPDSISWCGAFVSFCLNRARLIDKGSARAADWLNFGEALSRPRPGCVAVLRPQAEGSTGHVGFWLNEEAGRIQLLAGNQHDRVDITTYPVSDLQEGGLRWPQAAAA